MSAVQGHTATVGSPTVAGDKKTKGKFLQKRLREFNYLGFGFVAFLLLLWEVAVRSGYVQVFGLPQFSDVVIALAKSIANGELLQALIPTLWRWTLGYGAAVIVGVIVGMLMGYSRFVYRLLEPVTELVRPIPSPAYVPIAILFLGIDDAMKVAVTAFASVFPTMLSTYSGVRAIDSVQMDTARTFGVSRTTTIFHVVLPAAAPYIFTGMRVSLAVSLILTVIAEMIAGNSGIGYHILLAQRSFQISDMYAGIITLGALGYALNHIFLWVEASVLSWQRATTAQND
jgi:ABC-type nitrate/sulfonate/bicarbonate transport system permease component